MRGRLFCVREGPALLGLGGSDWWVSLVLVDQIGPRLVSFDSGGLDLALVGQGL